MSESKAITKIFYIFLFISFSSGFAIICFTDLRTSPAGKIIQFRAKVYPYKWQLRTGLLLLLLLLTVVAFVAAIKELHRLNIVLAAFVFILLIVEISLAGKWLTWRNEQTEITKEQGDGNTMLQQYGINPAITKIMDYVQSSYSCCGVTDYRDWATTNWAAQVVSILTRSFDIISIQSTELFAIVLKTSLFSTSSSHDPEIRMFHCLFIVLKISLLSTTSSHDPEIRMFHCLFIVSKTSSFIIVLAFEIP